MRVMQSVIVSLHASCWHFLAAITLATLPSLCNVRINLHKHLKAVIPPLDCFFPSISKTFLLLVFFIGNSFLNC